MNKTLLHFQLRTYLPPSNLITIKKTLKLKLKQNLFKLLKESMTPKINNKLIFKQTHKNKIQTKIFKKKNNCKILIFNCLGKSCLLRLKIKYFQLILQNQIREIFISLTCKKENLEEIMSNELNHHKSKSQLIYQCNQEKKKTKF